MLVDQKFTNGIPTTFFGRPCETSPLLPKLVRQYECDVYPARCIRLPDNRFRLIIEPKLELPRTEKGRIDIDGTAQMLNDVVERWVREDPGQWMWFHKRWKITHRTRHRRARSLVKGALGVRSTAVIIHHGMPRFGEEQPAFQKHAGNVACGGQQQRANGQSWARPTRRRSP